VQRTIQLSRFFSDGHLRMRQWERAVPWLQDHIQPEIERKLRLVILGLPWHSAWQGFCLARLVDR
jgi:hypothetical protein